jgi:hypothetical protein
MAEDATLRDVTVTDPVDPNVDLPADKPATDAASKEPTVNLTADSSKDAAELGQILLDSGFSKDNVNDLLQTPNALQSIQFMIRNNPAEFLNMLERTDANAAKAFHEKMADIYVDRYSTKGEPAAKGGKDADPGLMDEVRALREETRSLRTNQEQRDNAAALARLESQYRGRVDELFNKVKEAVPLTKSEERALRATLDADLATDTGAKKRISNGNFVDVPTKLNTIIRDWSNDRKQAAEADKSRREGTSRRGMNEFQNGPGPVDIPANLDYSDDNAFEKAFANALEQASR